MPQVTARVGTPARREPSASAPMLRTYGPNGVRFNITQPTAVAAAAIQSGAGTPRNEERPRSATEELAYTIRVDDRNSPTPRPTNMVASVTMNAGSPNLTTNEALIAPNDAPTRIDAGRQIHTGA